MLRSHWKSLELDRQIGWGRISKNPHSRVKSFSSINGNSDLEPFCARSAEWVESSTKKQWHLPVPPFLEIVVLTPVPLALALQLVNLVFPHMSLIIFELLPLHWSLEQVSLSQIF